MTKHLFIVSYNLNFSMQCNVSKTSQIMSIYFPIVLRRYSFCILFTTLGCEIPMFSRVRHYPMPPFSGGLPSNLCIGGGIAIKTALSLAFLQSHYWLTFYFSINCFFLFGYPYYLVLLRSCAEAPVHRDGAYLFSHGLLCPQSVAEWRLLFSTRHAALTHSHTHTHTLRKWP